MKHQVSEESYFLITSSIVSSGCGTLLKKKKKVKAEFIPDVLSLIQFGVLHFLLHRIPAPFCSGSDIPAVHIYLAQALWNEAKKQISAKPREVALSSTFSDKILYLCLKVCFVVAAWHSSCNHVLSVFLSPYLNRNCIPTDLLQRKQKMLIIFTVGLSWTSLWKSKWFNYSFNSSVLPMCALLVVSGV